MMCRYQAVIELGKSKDYLIFEKFIEDSKGIEISLEVVSRDGLVRERLKVFFSSNLAYLCRDEGDMVRVWMEIDKGDRLNNHIYLVQDSRFLKLFNDDSSEMGSHHVGLKHWMIATQDQVFDVISKEPPVVIRENNPQ